MTVQAPERIQRPPCFPPNYDELNEIYSSAFNGLGWFAVVFSVAIVLLEAFA